MKRTIFFCIILLTCYQRKVIINNTNGYLAFERSPEGPYDDNLWLINIKTGEELVIANNPDYLEHTPIWLNDHELLYLFEKYRYEEQWFGYLNFQTGEKKYIPLETPSGVFYRSLSMDSSKDIYCALGVDVRMDNAIGVLTLNNDKYEYRDVLSNEDVRESGMHRFYDVRVSPDGDKMLLAGRDTATHRYDKEKKAGVHDDIYLLDLTMDNKREALQRLTDDNGVYHDHDPSWLDNHRILFSSDRDGNAELYIIDLVNKKIERLTFTEEVHENNPVVSPDGKLIAYTQYHDKPLLSEIWLMDLATRESRYLTEGDNPTWSPAR